jgi:hypothetical protein
VTRGEFIVADAWLTHGRRLTPERGEEIAAEVAGLLAASKELGARLRFDDQASDFACTLIETSRA